MTEIKISSGAFLEQLDQIIHMDQDIEEKVYKREQESYYRPSYSKIKQEEVDNELREIADWFYEKFKYERDERKNAH